MKLIDNTVAKISSFIDRHKTLKYLKSVHQRYEKDNGNNKVGYITYYMFLSFLPLLLVSLTVFDIILTNNKELRDRLVESTFSSIPVIGPTLEADINFVSGRGVTLIVTLLLLIWAARGGALALQDALTQILARKDSSHSFISKQLRAYLALAVISIGIIVPTAIGSIFSNSYLSQLIIFILSIAWNVLVIYLIFYLLVEKQYAWGIGTLIGGISIALIQLFSILIVTRTLDNARPLYGTLAVVLALMFWISLQVKVLLYSAVMNSLKTS